MSSTPPSSTTRGSGGHGMAIVMAQQLPSGYVKIAIENGPVEIVDLSIKNRDFPANC